MIWVARQGIRGTEVFAWDVFKGQVKFGKVK